MTVCLQSDALEVGYPGRSVGAGLSLSVSTGEVLVLLGPNACGKTTWLKTLLGLLPPRQGEVHLLGRPLTTYGSRERARLMAYVPQSQVSTFGFSALELVVMGRTAHLGLLERPTTRDRAVALDAMRRMGIEDLAQRSIHQISGGQRQLVLIARALAQEPRVVLLDEPTASLDFGNQGRVLHAMRALAQQGLAVLFTTHDPNQAIRHADRAVLMRDGGVLASGAVNEVVHLDGLRRLYRAEVVEVSDHNGGHSAYLPGSPTGVHSAPMPL
jgi:iron complex transport system ATP-binding protein